MKNALMAHVEAKHLKSNVTAFDVGDIVDVHQKIVEGDKERIQVFSGTVILKKGEGINATFTVRRIVNNEGVERIFPVHSPKIEKIDVKRKSRVRRAKLYYLRERTGKATRLKEGEPIVVGETPTAATANQAAPAKPAEAAPAKPAEAAPAKPAEAAPQA
jgi:large subunit ribosomal protein L19